MSNIGNLTVTIKPGEQIRIGGEVVVAISELRPTRVTLTISAPKSLRIERVKQAKPNQQV